MATPSRQIGWSQTEILLNQISKQLETLTKVTYYATNNVTVYSEPLSFPISYVSFRFKCDGNDVGNNIYTSETVNNIAELVAVFNADATAKTFGTFGSVGTDILTLSTTKTVKNAYCPAGTLTMYVFSD